MKIRTDFVTNSSSSSFIINKISDIKSVEDLFQLMKRLYTDWADKKDKLLEFCKNDNRFNVETTKDGFTRITAVNVKPYGDEWDALDDMLQDKFDIGMWDNIDYDLGWLSCKTYEDFQEFYKGQSVDYGGKPFEIYDFNKKDKNEEEIEEMNHVVSWYFLCFNDDHRNEWDSCKYCDYKDSECCKELQNSSEKHHCIGPNSIGNLCVSSESGFIPELIVDKLSGYCTHYCNHMG